MKVLIDGKWQEFEVEFGEAHPDGGVLISSAKRWYNCQKGVDNMEASILEGIRRNGQYPDKTWRKYTVIYDAMAIYEELHQTSFNDMTPQMVINFLNQQQYSDIHSVQAALQVVRAYAKATNQSAAIGIVTASEISLLNGIRKELVPSLNELYRRIKLFTDLDSGNYLIPACTFAWMGMPLDEALSIHTDWIDLDTGVIHTDTPLIYERLSEEMLTAMRRYRTTPPQKGRNRQNLIPDMNERSEFIFRMLSITRKNRGAPIPKNEVSRQLALMQAAYRESQHEPMDMGYKDIIRSSKFAKLYAMECTGIDWNTQQNGTLMQEVYQTSRIEPSYLRHNYNSYKKAFSLK